MLHIQRFSRKNVKTRKLLPKRLMSLPSLLKKRMLKTRIQAIKTELAARTLYVIDGEVIVITSLDRKPFCCQEELSIMSRHELCRIARELNQKLPYALHIEPLHHLPTEVIRIQIEEMMGFRHLRICARTVNIERRQSNVGLEFLSSHQNLRGKRSPTSSFSSASSLFSAPHGLAVVNETDEETGDTKAFLS